MKNTQNTQNTTTATANDGTKKVDKIAKVNFKNSAVLDLIIDKSIYKLDAVKNFVANVGEYPNTDSLQKFVEICNNLIFNQAINDKIALWQSAKATFIANIQDKSLNYFKNILHNSYLVSRNDALAIEKETHTEVVCDKRFLLKNSVAKYFKHAMLAILTDNGKKLIRFNSIKGEFSLVEDEPVEEIEG